MLNVLSLFSGIGAFEKALENLGIPHNVLAYCEIDKYASKAYSIIHDIPEEKNLKDVTKVDILDICERVDLITYGFPCQDISNCGKQNGFVDENGERTRSGLFFDALRIIDDYKPKFAIAENVKNLTSKRFKEEFKIVLESLEALGYNNYWQVLNSKDYGIPQNRERVFIISIRKDINKGFKFLTPFPLTLKLKDLLDDEIDESFYLSTDLIISPEKSNGRYLLVKEATKRGYKEAYPGDSVNFAYPNSKCRRGRVGNQITNTLLASNVEQGVVVDSEGNLRIKILTPSEYYKLMGFTAEDCKKASDGGISNTQLYKQAGNSIVVNVLEAIFKSLGERYEEFRSVS